MNKVVGIRFKKAGKIYYFAPGDHQVGKGDFAIVETARGVEYGEVVTDIKEVEDKDIVAPLKPIIRKATAADAVKVEDNKKKEKEAFAICQKKIEARKLEMHLVDVEYTFDVGKIIFYFTAEGRIDFRELVKDLAAIFRTRIELRQIGVRDEAKLLGGIGCCGRPLCCASFLGDFEPVSIRMAKDQNLSLNPTKISGICGRLLCCLKYENDQYVAEKKKQRKACKGCCQEREKIFVPKPGLMVVTPTGEGRIVSVNRREQTISVELSQGNIISVGLEEVVPKDAVEE